MTSRTTGEVFAFFEEVVEFAAGDLFHDDVVVSGRLDDFHAFRYAAVGEHGQNGEFVDHQTLLLLVELGAFDHFDRVLLQRFLGYLANSCSHIRSHTRPRTSPSRAPSSTSTSRKIVHCYATVIFALLAVGVEGEDPVLSIFFRLRVEGNGAANLGPLILELEAVWGDQSPSPPLCIHPKQRHSHYI